MLQLPVIVVLMISMFVGSVSPVSQQEGHNSNVDVEHLKETTAILDSNSNKTDKPPIKTTNDTKDVGTVNATNNSASLKNSTSLDVSTPIKGDKEIKNDKENCTSTKEQEDMLGCHVTPPDDDDAIEKSTTLNTTDSPVNTTAATNSKTEVTTESQVPNVPPHKDEEENGGKDMETSVNTQTTNQVSYDVVSVDTNHTVDTNNSDSSANSKHDLNTNETSITVAPPLLEDKVAAGMGSENIGAVKSADQVDDNNKHMPSGIIALVTAISFAVAIALVYIGMIVWRRYIEYRYGHRELLVNELEFDTNDLRHFEL